MLFFLRPYAACKREREREGGQSQGQEREREREREREGGANRKAKGLDEAGVVAFFGLLAVEVLRCMLAAAKLRPTLPTSRTASISSDRIYRIYSPISCYVVTSTASAVAPLTCHDLQLPNLLTCV